MRWALRTACWRALLGAGLVVLLWQADPVAAGAETLGRLFTTPAERAALERLRHPQAKLAEAPKPVKRQVVELPPASPPPVPEVSVQGVVTRSDGQNVVWVNGETVLQSGPAGQGLRVETGRIRGDSVPIVLPGDKATIHLQPGQVYNPADSKVLDAYRANPSGADSVKRAGRAGAGQP